MSTQDPSQLVNPASQTIEQTPAVQDGVPLVDGQTLPHPPQLFKLLLVSKQFPPQHVVPVQTVPQLPQWLLSVAKLKHSDEH